MLSLVEYIVRCLTIAQVEFDNGVPDTDPSMERQAQAELGATQRHAHA